jgi:3-hydroxyacyl-[acyl-carrier-protein] dehydratase
MSLVMADVRVLRPVAEDGSGWDAEAAIDIDPAEPVFAGHYPGFPIFPGVCVVDSVHRGALATTPEQAGVLTLAAVDSARFVGAVYPGDVLRMRLRWRRDGPDWLCGTKASTESGEVASVRLRYRNVS